MIGAEIIGAATNGFDSIGAATIGLATNGAAATGVGAGGSGTNSSAAGVSEMDDSAVNSSGGGGSGACAAGIAVTGAGAGFEITGATGFGAGGWKNAGLEAEGSTRVWRGWGGTGARSAAAEVADGKVMPQNPGAAWKNSTSTYPFALAFVFELTTRQATSCFTRGFFRIRIWPSETDSVRRKTAPEGNTIMVRVSSRTVGRG